MPNIYGFTLLRNGNKYDYCYKECLTSLSKVTKKIYLALGAGDDGTEESIKEFDFIDVIPTVWDEKLREGGLILSQQTNVALRKARETHAGEGAWGIYLQCDEVFHEEDYELIMEDIKKADEQGCDVVRFRYLHFWMNHHSLAINKKWYPQEIRAVKLDTNIESWGDAQSFRNFEKAYESDARIFHYGHVREEDSYKNKKADILKLYHSDEKLPKYKKREKKFDDQTEVLDFWGNHPRIMKERIERLGDIFEMKEREKCFIVSKDPISQSFLNKINAKEVQVVDSLGKVPNDDRSWAINLNPGILTNLFHSSHVPNKMRSKLAREWPQEFILMLKLSEKGFGLKSTD